MALTIIAGAVVFLLTAIVFAQGLSDQNQANTLQLWEQALSSADAGVDNTLFTLATDRAWTTGEVVPASFATKADERAWVEAQIADNPTGKASEAEWAVLKPSNAAVVYAVGYSPSRAAPRRTRMIRVQYDFAPFVPSEAILTDGNLTVSGSPVVLGAGGNAHANGNVVVTGVPTFAGYVAASGTLTGAPIVGDLSNTGGGKPRKDIPLINPRVNYALSQYDLCPNGDVRAGPAYPGPEAPNPTAIPCVGTLLDTATSTEYRGWKMPAGNDWTYGGNTAYDGVYYAYQSSAKVSGNPGSDETPWNVTIFAEASAAGPDPHCPHTGGDIEFSGNPRMRGYPTAYPLLLVAGRDLKISGNPGLTQKTYSGVMLAHEQFNVSGNPSIGGAIISNDVCDTAGSAVSAATTRISGNPDITYDAAHEVPIGNIPRITLWLEV